MAAQGGAVVSAVQIDDFLRAHNVNPSQPDPEPAAPRTASSGTPAGSNSEVGVPMPTDLPPLEERVRRAQSYAMKMPRAVAGRGGHLATWRLVLNVVRGFALDEARAWPILQVFNARCQPRWSEEELRHKLQGVVASSRRPWGFRLQARTAPGPWTSASGSAGETASGATRASTRCTAGDAASGTTTGANISTVTGAAPTMNATAPRATAGLTFHRTDLGNAARLVHRHGHSLRYCDERGGWFRFDGVRWRSDGALVVQDLAHETVRQILADAALLQDSDEMKLLAAHAIKSELTARIDAMIKSARSDVPVAMEQFDADPMLLNVQNGTIDLRTGNLLPHDRRNLMTKVAGVSFDRSATCPTWMTFLGTIFGNDSNLIEYSQRCCGYSMTGLTDEQSMEFAHGLGQNGKSTFFETIMTLMGDYAQKAAISMLLAKKTDGIPNDVARLKGARLVVASEIPSGRRLDESLVKDLTGGDTLTARFMRGEFFDFKPTHKLWMYGNHKPVIHGSDLGIWRRLHLIPFSVTIPEHQRDLTLKDKLRAELPGILNWMIAGCLAWQRQRLNPPQKVLDATRKYREDSDLLGDFLDAICNVGPGKFAPAGDLYRVYIGWCTGNGEEPVAQRTFGEVLTEKGFEAGKKGGVRGRIGLELDRTKSWGAQAAAP